MFAFYDPIEPDENFHDYRVPTKYQPKTELGKISREGPIVDGESTILLCSNCKAELATIKIIRPNSKVKSFIVALCDYCGDKSFKKEFIGGFCVGGTDQSSVISYPMETSTEGDCFIQNITIKTKKRDGNDTKRYEE